METKWWGQKDYWDKHNPDQENLSRLASFRLSCVPDVSHTAKLLDVGCGSGIVTKPLEKKGYSVTGLETDPRAISLCERKALEVRKVDVSREPFPFEDSLFDVVTCFELIEHIKDPDNMLTEIHRVLKEDGLLIISTPNINWWWIRLKFLLGKWGFHDMDHIRFYNKSLFERCLHDYGFEIEREEGLQVVPRLVRYRTRCMLSLAYDLIFSCSKK